MLLGAILIIGLVLLDQVFKILSIYLANGSEGLIKILIPDVLEFHYINNPGASFGMGEGMQLLFFVVTIIALLIFGYLFYEIDFKKKKVFSLAIILFIAGTFGNAIDRMFRPMGVVDMFNMPILNYLLSFLNIPDFIFNMADVYMNFAVILFIIDLLFLERKRVDVKNETNE